MSDTNVKYGYGKGSSGQYNAVLPNLSDGQRSELQLDSSGKLLVDATVTANFSMPQEVLINDVDDSIRIGDGHGHYLLVNPDGSINVSGIVTGTVDENLKGLNVFKTTNYTIGTSSQQLTPSPLLTRSTLIIKVERSNSNTVWVGETSGVTVGGGFPLYAGDTLQVDLTSAHSIYAISGAAGQLVYVFEMGA